MVNKRVLFMAILVLLVSFLLPQSLQAAEADRTFVSAETGYSAVIADDADLLSDAEELLLLSQMERVLPYGNAAFVTNTESNYDAQAFARSWYVDHLGQVTGTVFLIDMYNRRIEIFSGADVYKTISTVRANEITDNVYTYATNGQYYRCADAAFDQIATILEGGAIVTPMKYATSAAFAVGIALLINFIIIYMQRRKPKDVLALKSAVAPEKVSGSGAVRNVSAVMTNRTRHRHVEASGGVSGGGGGGGFSGGGGGGGGGGFSGGGGGHSF